MGATNDVELCVIVSVDPSEKDDDEVSTGASAGTTRNSESLVAEDFPYRVTPTWFLAAASITTIIFGTTNSLLIKLMNRQQLPPCKGCAPAYFEGPLFQTFLSHLGQCFVFPVYLMDLYIAQKRQKLPVFDFAPSITDCEKPRCPRWMWIFPLLLDALSTCLLNYAIALAQASSVQMLRSMSTIIAFLMAAYVLKNKIYIHQLLGVIFVSVGLVFVAAFAFLNPEGATNHTAYQWIGIIAAIIATMINSGQWALEEAYFRRYYCSPFEAVGLMGIYGVILDTSLLLILQSVGFHDLGRALYQMSLGQKESMLLICFGAGYCISLLFNTTSGKIVTKLSSALLRTVINSARMVALWSVELLLGWTFFDGLNFTGMVLIIIAVIIYNYNYMTDSRNHWKGDYFLRQPVPCLPNKVEVTHRSIDMVCSDFKESTELSKSIDSSCIDIKRGDWNCIDSLDPTMKGMEDDIHHDRFLAS